MRKPSRRRSPNWSRSGAHGVDRARRCRATTAGRSWSPQLLVALASWALRPALVWVARRFGWVGTALIAVFAQAVILGAALWFTPGMTEVTVLAAGARVVDLRRDLRGGHVALRGEHRRVPHRARRARSAPRRPHGRCRGRAVPPARRSTRARPRLRGARGQSATVIGSWLREGTHAWTEWTARVPSTTPVSQAGILHGSTENLPAFRWHDRELNRMLVANRPADAAVIESARKRWPRPARRRRRLDLQPLQRRRANVPLDHELTGRDGKRQGSVGRLRGLPHAPGRPRARADSHPRRDGQGGVPGAAPKAARCDSRAFIAGAPTSLCAASPMCCFATSTWRSRWRR